MKIPVYYPFPGIRGNFLDNPKDHARYGWVYKLYSSRAIGESKWDWDNVYGFVESKSS